MTPSARLQLFLGLALSAALVGLAVATQTVAAGFHFPLEFGRGLADLGHLRIYPPWAYVGWYAAYERLYPRAFDEAALWGLGAAMIPISIAVGVMRRTARSPRAFGAAAWARLEDVRRARLIDPRGKITGRVLGRFAGRYLTYQGVEHAIIVGASRSGKGAGHVVPTLVAWPQSAFIYDRKGELWHITADHRKQFSHVFFFAPTDPNTVRWNPLFEVRKGPMEIADIQNVVGILVDPLGRKAGDLNFWDQSATDFFTAVILHVLYSEPDADKTLAQVRRLLINIEPTLHAMMHTQHRHRPDPHARDGLARDDRGEPIPEIHPEVLLGARALDSMDERVKSNVLATCRASLMLWADPMVEYATSTSDFSIGDLVCAEAPVSFYMITPQAHADRLAFLVRVFTRQTINSLMESEHTDSRRRKKRHRLLMMLDEFPKLGALPFLENAMGEMAGYGITAHLVCQSFNDVFSKYGDKTPLFDNMHITAAFATSEPTSIEKVTRRAGKALEMRESFSDPRTIFGRAHRSTSQSEQQRYILSEEDVRGLDDRKQFLFVNNAKPIQAEKIRYYEEPFFQARTGDYFHGQLADYEQKPGLADLPCAAHNDWKGVSPVGAPPPPFKGVQTPAAVASARIDPADYLGAQTPHHAHSHYDDDGLV
ncbi:MAG TPA: type IV secretory system conjugative DNA transfer family protein [Caulobacteraceae bacterium]|nr:type IV secretory system conjugative DNA transfer family protein [Caulobacteraceae bacterium]